MVAYNFRPDRQIAEAARMPPAPDYFAGGRRDLARARLALHPAIAFLSAYGVPPGVLARAEQISAAQRVRPEQALLACGLMREDDYYNALARHLGLAHADDDIVLGAAASYPASQMAGAAPLEHKTGEPRWLLAPEGRRLDELLRLHRRGRLPRNSFAIASPSQLSRLVFEQCGAEIAAKSANGLSRLLGARWSAATANPFMALIIAAPVLALGLAWQAGGAAWTAVSLPVTAFLCAAIVLKLFAAAASCDAEAEAAGVPDGRELPLYSIIVAVYREANIAAQLIAALDAIDYPAAKLEIFIVTEESDHETRAAFADLELPARYRILAAPPGNPRTKPRALNVALALARGEYICVFDAEDIPQPGQLREAAALFAASPPRVACLQGRLAIDNHADGWLATMFAIDYAGLFDATNPGLAALRMPVPLGGTSNHFRATALRAAGGWDAWNVTEDIDLGIRLARFGYETGTLKSSTHEEAPATLAVWMRQRRRWFKGWMQTLIVHARDPVALVRDLGPLRACVAIVLAGGTIAVAMLGPVCLAFAFHGAMFSDLLYPATIPELLASTLWCFTFAAGLAAAVWPAWLGLRRRGLGALCAGLALMPLYWGLLTVASWWALADLLRDPHGWLKTPHGLARHRAIPPPGNA